MKISLLIRKAGIASWLTFHIVTCLGQIIIQKDEAYQKMDRPIKTIVSYYIPYCEDTFEINRNADFPLYPSSVGHYSREGNLIEWDLFYNGKVSSYFSFNYDSLNRILNENALETGEEVKVFARYTYLNDTLVRINDTSDFSFITEWFRKLNKVGNITDEYYYSENGDSVNLLEIKYDGYSRRVYERRNSLNESEIDSIEYDENGNIVKKVIQFGKNKLIYLFEYDRSPLKETRTIWIKRNDEEPFLTKEIRIFDEHKLLYKIYSYSAFNLCHWGCSLNKFEFYRD